MAMEPADVEGREGIEEELFDGLDSMDSVELYMDAFLVSIDCVESYLKALRELGRDVDGEAAENAWDLAQACVGAAAQWAEAAVEAYKDGLGQATGA
ncbi:hypothetical protein [Xiamenia xianingshaonis]|uniref:Uncharacterized protein n=1 Tax=Xiamenia xianingshaonis TaxID=2682776 RepID=A0ABX0IK53_9ACTN|nr:hypothetical protein [Xiamenia xianingshaonis]NHM13513.1 hypothetical protein [Xiamenia xianingshaonis]